MAALIAYFSRAGENYVNGTIRDLAVGNTEVAAGLLQELTGADCFRIEPCQPYAKDYDTCIEEARADQRRDARPRFMPVLIFSLLSILAGSAAGCNPKELL